MASSQVQHVCQLSRTVVDGLVTRVRRIGDLLALVPDSAQLASQRAAVDTLTALRTLLEQAHVAVPLDAAAQTPYSVPQFACNADAPDAAQFSAHRAALHHASHTIALQLLQLRSRIDVVTELADAVELARVVRSLKSADRTAVATVTPLPSLPGAAAAIASPPTSPGRARAGSVMTTPPASRDNYQQQAWFHNVSRLAAEDLLVDKPLGAFLVRPASVAGCLSLTYKDLVSGSIGHGLLRYHSGPQQVGWGYEDDQTIFGTVQQLLDTLPLNFDPAASPSSSSSAHTRAAPKPAPTPAATPLSPRVAKPLPTVPGRQSVPSQRPAPSPIAVRRPNPAVAATLPARTNSSAPIATPATAASARLVEASALLDELADLGNPTIEIDPSVAAAAIQHVGDATPHQLLASSPVRAPIMQRSSSVQSGVARSQLRSLPVTPGSTSPPRALSPAPASERGPRALPSTAAQQQQQQQAQQQAQRSLSPSRALPDGPRRPAPAPSLQRSVSVNVRSSTSSASTTPTLMSAASTPVGSSQRKPTELAPVTFEREAPPTIDRGAVDAQLTALRRAHAAELAEIDASVRARVAADDATPFEANGELDAKLALLLKRPGASATPTVFVEYARMAQQPGASEILQELAPLIEQLQRLTWARAFAETQVAREEQALQRDRHAFLAKRAQVAQLSALSGRGAARRLAVRSALLSAAARKLVDPTESLKGMLDEFDVRQAPLNKIEPTAVELFRAPQAQLRRSIAELSFLALEIESHSNELLDASQYLSDLLHQLKI